MIVDKRLMAAVVVLLCSILISGSFAGEVKGSNGNILPKGLQGISIGGVYHLNFQYYQENNKDYSELFVHRAYLTVKKEILPFLSARITLDTNQDGEGDGEGDMEVRVKYVYADFKLNDMGFITKPHIEFGMVHGPWFDFEEHVNYYRMRDQMFAERSGVLNSADYGFTAAAYLGGEVNKEYQKKVNSKYPGKYGSFAFGVYNGGGYHGVETNRNKVVEGRLTIRPLPEKFTGLQFSIFGIYGKGNKAADLVSQIPDWNLLLAMISLENQYYTFTGQYLTGKGNQKGSWVDASDPTESTSINGYSLFAEVKPDSHWRGIAGFDSFDSDTDVDDNAYNRYYAGIGYDFGHHNVLILDYNVKDFELDGVENENWLQLTMQIHY